ncbi:50S ribosomal protein L28 [bacterium]|nr:50S ribosomal protein L28 [bacterium]
MPRCQICGKKSITIITRKKLRGKFNPTSKKKQHPNLQWTTLPNGKRIRVCTQCLKKLYKT